MNSLSRNYSYRKVTQSHKLEKLNNPKPKCQRQFAKHLRRDRHYPLLATELLYRLKWKWKTASARSDVFSYGNTEPSRIHRWRYGGQGSKRTYERAGKANTWYRIKYRGHVCGDQVFGCLSYNRETYDSRQCNIPKTGGGAAVLIWWRTPNLDQRPTGTTLRCVGRPVRRARKFN